MSSQPAFVKIADLYQHTSRKGTKYLVGDYDGLRVYVFENTEGRRAKDCKPSHRLCIRTEDVPPPEGAKGE